MALDPMISDKVSQITTIAPCMIISPTNYWNPFKDPNSYEAIYNLLAMYEI